LEIASAALPSRARFTLRFLSQPAHQQLRHLPIVFYDQNVHGHCPCGF
jgi:hypothetical protein